jgi:CRISP-associated protein Cas1
MSFKTLTIDSPAELHVHKGQLTALQDGVVTQVSLDDLACVVFSHPDITISSAALAYLGESGISILTCGRNYMPATITLPFAPHSLYSGIVAKQLGASLGFRNSLWKTIVKRKILNQAKTLELLGVDGSALTQLAGEVRSGDPTNREALAARLYFSLLSPGYTRDSICPLSSALNYGYAVVRSTLARHVVSHGFITSVGLHHCNERNEFNLVDDLIEPFRPLVDLHVMGIDLAGENPAGLSRSVRKQITSVLRCSCEIDGCETSLLIAAEKCVESLGRALEVGGVKEIRLPTIVEASAGEGES